MQIIAGFKAWRTWMFIYFICQVLQQMQETQISSKEAGYLELASYPRKYNPKARDSLFFIIFIESLF